MIIQSNQSEKHDIYIKLCLLAILALLSCKLVHVKRRFSWLPHSPTHAGCHELHETISQHHVHSNWPKGLG